MRNAHDVLLPAEYVDQQLPKSLKREGAWIAVPWSDQTRFYRLGEFLPQHDAYVGREVDHG